jgi:hypothetical protein
MGVDQFTQWSVEADNMWHAACIGPNGGFWSHRHPARADTRSQVERRKSFKIRDLTAVALQSMLSLLPTICEQTVATPTGVKYDSRGFPSSTMHVCQ